MVNKLKDEGISDVKSGFTLVDITKVAERTISTVSTGAGWEGVQQNLSGGATCPGQTGIISAGLISAGLVSAGLISAGLVSAGLSATGAAGGSSQWPFWSSWLLCDAGQPSALEVAVMRGTAGCCYETRGSCWAPGRYLLLLLVVVVVWW
jgi:hypothetical protein